MSNKSFIKNISIGILKRIKNFRKDSYSAVNVNWITLKYYKHLSPGKLRVHKLFSEKLYFYSPIELLHGLREIFIENIYKFSSSPSPYILDCGANIGLSIIYFKRLFPEAIIVAFEPDEINFDILTRNINSFKLKDVQIHKEAVWKEDTILHFSNEGSMGSKIEVDHKANTREVKAIRLKNFIVRKIDFLKIDIEGAEYEVLKDIATDLHHVNNMFLEYHGTFRQNDELATIIEIVKCAGFSFYIKEAAEIYPTPFSRQRNPNTNYDIQLNIFCFRS